MSAEWHVVVRRAGGELLFDELVPARSDGGAAAIARGRLERELGDGALLLGAEWDVVRVVAAARFRCEPARSGGVRLRRLEA